MSWVSLAIEDEVAEWVGRKLLHEAGLQPSQILRQHGFGYLKSRVRQFCEMARVRPVVMFTDLDAAPCVVALRDDWFSRDERPENFVFRVCVREVEAWLMADVDRFSQFLSIRADSVPEPDGMADPKGQLLALARRCPRRLRNELVAQDGAISAQGLGYNALLSEFVRNRWRPRVASQRSESLARAMVRLRDLKAREADWS